jgi:hypothetical protein
MSFLLVRNLSEEPEGLGIPNAFGTMTESDKDVASVITLLVKGFPIRLRLRSERKAMNSEEYLFYRSQSG